MMNQLPSGNACRCSDNLWTVFPVAGIPELADRLGRA